MARCRASVLIGQTTKSIDVIFSSGSQISYISDRVATDLGIPMKVEDITTTIEDVGGHKSNCTKTASINLILGTLQQVVKAIVLPNGIPYLVLGADWFMKYSPTIDFGGGTISISVKHTIQMEKNDTGTLLAPAVWVVSRTANLEKKAKPVSRKKFIKEGWGDRVNFQASYGLGMSPEDIEEGNKILEAMEKADEGVGQGGQK